ncbi:MAG: hypothetical protein U0166_14715 [Acidobacteriota bacterium]
MKRHVVPILLAALATRAFAASVSVPITVTERIGVARIDEPVLVGVPLPQSFGVLTPSGLGLQDGGGAYVPSEVFVTARWGGTPTDATRPIKWLLVAFRASVGAGQQATYTLTAVSGTPPSTVTLTQGPGVWTVDTGAAQFEIATTGFDLFHRVTIGGVDIVTPGATNGPYFTLGGSTYRSSGTASLLSVVRQGAQSLTVKVKGAHRVFDYNPGNQSSGTASNDLKLNTYLTFTAGSSTVLVHHTVHDVQDWVLLVAPNNEVSGDFREIGSPNSQWADEIGLATQMTLGANPRYTIATAPTAPLPSASLNTLAQIYQDSSGDPNWEQWAITRGTQMPPTWQKVTSPIYGPQSYVSFRGFKAWTGSTPWYNTPSFLAQGDRMSGYLDVTGGNGGLTVAVRDYAAEYPKTLRATAAGDVQVALLAGDFRARHNFRVGEQKTHTIVYAFHGPNPSPAALASAGAMAASPLVALAPSSWYCEMTRAVPSVSTTAPLAYRFATIAGDPTYQIADIAPPDWDAYQVRHITGPGSPGYTFDGLDDIVPASQMLSWMDHGDVPIDFEDESQCGGAPNMSITGQYNWKYDGDYGLLVQLVRSGDPRFFDYGIAAARHTADIDTMHHGRQSGRGIDDYLDGGMFGHEQHDQNGDKNPHRNGDYFSPCGSGGWNGTPTADMIYGAGAMGLAYLLTGEEPFLESMKDIGDWTALFASNYGTDGDRPSANTLNTLAWAYEITGDPAYRAAADGIIANNAVFTSPMGQSFAASLFGAAVGHYVAVLHERNDTSQDGVLTTVVSQAPQFLNDNGVDSCRSDAYAWAALLLSSGVAQNMGLADAAFANGAKYPAFLNNQMGIGVVWQVKEWVYAVKCGNVYQLAVYQLLGGPGPGTGTGDFVLGQGLGQPNPNRVRVYTGAGAATAVDFLAYSAGQWGANVATGNVDSDANAEIITGPGPGAVFGPQVRGFKASASPMGKINFYAYGTLRYGVNVGAGEVDGDAFAEIQTGPGPGPVFGPHVRGWNFDGSALTAIQKISYFAYGTLKYGVNVSSGNVDTDGFAEILTGPGPGIVFGPQVRGWNYDGAAIASINKINFNAFAVNQYGVNLAGGDFDSDAFAEIAATPGPGPGAGFPSRFLGFNYDGATIAPLAGFDVTPYATLFGGRVGAGDVTPGMTDELLTGAGRDPAAGSLVNSYTYSGSALAVQPNAFAPFASGTFGVNVAAGALGY